RNQTPEQLGPARVKIHGHDSCFWVLLGNDARLTAWCSTAIQNILARTDKQRDELRGFVLNDKFAIAPRNVTSSNDCGPGSQSSSLKLNAVMIGLVIRITVTNPNGCVRRRLVMFANPSCGPGTIDSFPTLDQPERMSGAEIKSCLL